MSLFNCPRIKDVPFVCKLNVLALDCCRRFCRQSRALPRKTIHSIMLSTPRPTKIEVLVSAHCRSDQPRPPHRDPCALYFIHSPLAGLFCYLFVTARIIGVPALAWAFPHLHTRPCDHAADVKPQSRPTTCSSSIAQYFPSCKPVHNLPSRIFISKRPLPLVTSLG